MKFLCLILLVLGFSIGTAQSPNSTKPRAVLTIICSQVTANGEVSCDLQFYSLGLEQALSASVSFDTSQLEFKNVQGVELDATYLVNSNQPGKIGIIFSKNPGLVFSPGIHVLLKINFKLLKISGVFPLTFGDIPVAKEVLGPGPNVVEALFMPGAVSLGLPTPQVGFAYLGPSVGDSNNPVYLFLGQVTGCEKILAMVHGQNFYKELIIPAGPQILRSGPMVLGSGQTFITLFPVYGNSVGPPIGTLGVKR